MLNRNFFRELYQLIDITPKPTSTSTPNRLPLHFLLRNVTLFHQNDTFKEYCLMSDTENIILRLWILVATIIIILLNEEVMCLLDLEAYPQNHAAVPALAMSNVVYNS